MQPLTPDDVVRGQYAGYREEKDVAADSDVETFCALRLFIDSWRWAGVPWYLRAGKRLPNTAAEVLVQLQPPPQKLFDDARPMRRPRQLPALQAAAGLGDRARGSRQAPGQGIRRRSARALPLRRRRKRRRRPTSGCSAMRWPATAPSSPVRTRSRPPGRWSTRCSRITMPRCPTRPARWGPGAADALIAGDGGWHNPEPDPRAEA